MSTSNQQEAPAGADRKLWIASGRGQRSLGRVRQHLETWPEFVKRLRAQQTTLPVTKEEYGKFSLEQKAAIKTDLSWSIGAKYDDTGRRKKENLEHRDTVNIDVDKQTPEAYAAVEAKVRAQGCAFLHVSSASNEVSGLRSGRFIAPLSRSVTLDEFDAVSRKVSEHLGIESVDPVSHRPNQVCFAPARCSDASMVFEEHAGPPLDVESTLGKYADWRDKSQRPRSSRETPDTDGGSSHLPDPREAPGYRGAFNRAYDVVSAIETFDLPYDPTSNEWRWTPHGATGHGGARVYAPPNDPTYAAYLYNDHQSGIRPKRNSCAYTLVRVYKFGDLDKDAALGTHVRDLPSTAAMKDWICKDQPNIAADVKLTIDAEFGNLDEDPDAPPASDPSKAEPAATSPEEAPSATAEPATGKLAKAKHLCTDLANANRLKKAFGRKILSIGGEFFVWTGTHWAKAINGEAHQYAGNLSQIVGREAKEAREKAEAALAEWEKTITPEQRERAKLQPRKHALRPPENVNILEAAALALERWTKECEMKWRKDAAVNWLRETHTLDPSMLDRDNWLFNAENCTIDLRTGKPRAHDPNDFITFCAPVRYDAEAKAPLFERFIKEVVGEETAGFLQRWYGYGLTGVVREHHLLVLWGGGRNGKGATDRAMRGVFGEYAGTAPRNLIADSGNGHEQHETEIMTLRGRRLVSAHESNKGAVLKEGFVKQMTGGDRLSGRFCHQDHVEFDPTHKAQLLTNHKPEVTGEDDGIWERLLLVQFPNKYKSAEDVAAGLATHVIDLTLEDRMREERSGIFNWLIQGCREWNRDGLRIPESVRKASCQYRSEQDQIGMFIKARCVMDPAARAEVTNCTESLHVAYRGWCAENEIRKPLGSTKFKQALLERPGIKEATWYVKVGQKFKKYRGVCGIRLTSEEELVDKPPEDPDPPKLGASAPQPPAEPADATPPAEPQWFDPKPEEQRAAAERCGTAAGSPEIPTPPTNGNHGTNGGTPPEDPAEVLRKGLRIGPNTAADLVRAGYNALESITDAAPADMLAALLPYRPQFTLKNVEELQERARKADPRFDVPPRAEQAVTEDA